MARVVVLTASSTIIAGPSESQATVIIRPRTAAQSIFLEMGYPKRQEGPMPQALISPVAAPGTGFEYKIGDAPLSIFLDKGCVLVGIAAVADQTIDVLITRK